MNELVVADQATEWLRLKALVLDSASSPITRRVYNPGAGRVHRMLHTRGLARRIHQSDRHGLARGARSEDSALSLINVRITAVRKLAVEPPTMVCWCRNSRPALPGSKASGRTEFVSGTGCRFAKRRRY